MKKLFTALALSGFAFAYNPAFAQQKKTEPTKEDVKKADPAKEDKKKQDGKKEDKKKVKKGGC